MKLTVLENCQDCQNVLNLITFLDVKHELKVFKTTKALTQQPFQEKSLYSTLPLIETEDGLFLNNYYSIMKYVASQARVTSLVGESDSARALETEFLLLIQQIDSAIAKWESLKDEDRANNKDLVEGLSKNLGYLERKLQYDMFLLGTKMSYVDILAVLSFKRAAGIVSGKGNLKNLKRVMNFLESSGLL